MGAPACTLDWLWNSGVSVDGDRIGEDSRVDEKLSGWIFVKSVPRRMFVRPGLECCACAACDHSGKINSCAVSNG
jgi:hypothetical protein